MSETGKYGSRSRSVTTAPAFNVAHELSKAHAFIGLNDHQLAQIEPLVELATFSANQVVVERHSRECDLFLIISGEVRVLDNSGERIADLGPGASLGEVALLDQQPRSATVVAKADTTIAVLPAMDLWMLMERRPDIGKTVLFNLGRILAGRLRSSQMHQS
jgi:CRP-like cAMP-binding protein